MLVRYFLVAIALGLALSSGALARAPTPADQETQSVTESRRQESAPASEQDNALQQRAYVDMVPALNRIEAAIRSLVAIESQPQPSEQEDREKRDLIAQEDMAASAMMMFWATVASVVLTAAALVTIAITLYYTKRAADHAKSMVVEAEKTTAAAIISAKATEIAATAAKEANEVARRQFEAGFKPWLIVKISGPYVDTSTSIERLSDSEPQRWVEISPRISIANVGDMPATIVKYYFGVRSATTSLQIGGWSEREDWEVLSKGDSFHPYPERLTGDGHYSIGGFMMDAAGRDEFFKERPPVIGWIEYLDPLGKCRRFGFAFQPIAVWSDGYARWGGEKHNYDREVSERA